MWPCRVIHRDSVANGLDGVLVSEVLIGIWPFVLHRIVHPLGHCVVQRVSALCHADAYLVCLQQIRILERGILDAPVGMVDEFLDADAVAPIECQPHLESLQRPFRLQRQAQAPAYDVAAVAVRQQRQVEKPFTVTNVGDVGHGHLPAGPCHELWCRVQQVPVDMEMMAGVCRTGTILFPAQHQAIGAQNVVEAVTANLELVAKILTAQYQKLSTACLWQTVG